MGLCPVPHPGPSCFSPPHPMLPEWKGYRYNSWRSCSKFCYFPHWPCQQKKPQPFPLPFYTAASPPAVLKEDRAGGFATVLTGRCRQSGKEQNASSHTSSSCHNFPSLSVAPALFSCGAAFRKSQRKGSSVKGLEMVQCLCSSMNQLEMSCWYSMLYLTGLPAVLPLM